MPKIVSCPTCTQAMQLRDEWIGHHVRCPACNATFGVRQRKSKIVGLVVVGIILLMLTTLVGMFILLDLVTTRNERNVARTAPAAPWQLAQANFSSAEALVKSGDLPQAAAAYRRVLELDPSRADALLGLMRCLGPEDDRFELTVRLARMGLNHERFLRLAEDRRHAGDWASLEVLCAAMFKIDGDWPATFYYDAAAKALAGKSDAAITQFQNAVARPIDQPGNAGWIAAFLRTIAHTGPVLQAYEAAPDAREAFRLLAFELGAQELPDDLQQLVNAHANIDASDILLPFFQAKIFLQQGRFKLATKAFSAAMALPPEDQILAQFRLDRIEALYYSGQVLTAYQEIGPKKDTFASLAGWCFENDDMASLKELVAARAGDFPGDIETLHWDSRLQLKLGETEKAVKLFQQALTVNKDDAKVQFVSDFLFDMAKAGKSVDAYLAAPLLLLGEKGNKLAVQGEKGNKFDRLANYLLQRGRAEELRQLISVHKKRSPGDLRTLCYAGELAVLQGDWDKAISEFSAAWPQIPPSSRAQFRRSYVLALHKSGNTLVAYDISDNPNAFSYGFAHENYHQLVELLIADKKGKELVSVVDSHSRMQGYDPDQEFTLARAAILMKDFAAAGLHIQQVFNNQQYLAIRANSLSILAADMSAAKLPLEFYHSAPDADLQTAFETLANVLVSEQNDQDLAALLQEHGKFTRQLVGEQPALAGKTEPDPRQLWLQVIEGELHLLRGAPDKAESCFVAVWNKGLPRDALQLKARNGLLRASIRQGKTVAAYQKFGPGQRVFGELAALCTKDNNAAELEALLAEYRQTYAGGREIPEWQAELCWLKADYEGVLKVLEDHRQEAFALPRHRSKYDSLLIKALLKLNRTQDAIQQAEIIARRPGGNRVWLVLAHASGGDVNNTIEAVTQLGPGLSLLWDCYHDENLGPILRGQGFREFRAKFPAPFYRQ
jgi:tetratricopeptide (TPR) repeat protein